MRNPNTTSTGLNFNTKDLLFVWEKGLIADGYDSTQLRKDCCGAWIKLKDYGNTDSDFGWEVDHIKPVARGGTDDLVNLQPLHWKNNRGKSDDYPHWSCSISAR